MEVFFSSLVIKPKDSEEINGVYRTDESLQRQNTRKVEVIGAGPGFWNQEKGEYEGCPFKVGDQLVVINHGWHKIDCESEDTWKIDMNMVIKRVED